MVLAHPIIDIKLTRKTSISFFMAFSPFYSCGITIQSPAGKASGLPSIEYSHVCSPELMDK
jgi:hypothetical protein